MHLPVYIGLRASPILTRDLLVMERKTVVPRNGKEIGTRLRPNNKLDQYIRPSLEIKSQCLK